MNNIESIVESLEDCVFNNNINGLMENFELLVKELAVISQDIGNKKDLLNEILNLVNIAFENKDYLLLADILRFELLPLLDKNYSQGMVN